MLSRSFILYLHPLFSMVTMRLPKLFCLFLSWNPSLKGKVVICFRFIVMKGVTSVLYMIKQFTIQRLLLPKATRPREQERIIFYFNRYGVFVLTALQRKERTWWCTKSILWRELVLIQFFHTKLKSAILFLVRVLEYPSIVSFSLFTKWTLPFLSAP